MRSHHKFALVGLVIGLVGIVLSIIALSTPAWISVDHRGSSQPTIYGLFWQCQANASYSHDKPSRAIIDCFKIDVFRAPQYLAIAGCSTFSIGIFLGIVSTAFIGKYRLQWIAPVLLFSSIVSLLLSMMIQIKGVIEHHLRSSRLELHYGYSMILMLVMCTVGIFLTAYFSFTAGYIHRHALSAVNAR